VNGNLNNSLNNGIFCWKNTNKNPNGGFTFNIKNILTNPTKIHGNNSLFLFIIEKTAPRKTNPAIKYPIT